jgi:hypothetical protein
MHQLFTKFDASIQLQFQQQQSEIEQIKEVCRQSKTQFATIFSDIDHLKTGVAMAGSAKYSGIQAREEAFDGAIDPCIIRINTREFVDRASIESAIEAWMLDGSFRLGSEFEIRGPPTALSKHWVIAMHGQEAVAQRRVRKALDLLKGADGAWRRITAVSPTDRHIDCYISSDKNKKRLATERLTKKAFFVLRDQLAGRRVHMLKAEGLICVGWKPLLRLSPFADGSFDAHWNPSMLQQTGINKQEVLAALEQAHGVSAEGVEWQL